MMSVRNVAIRIRTKKKEEAKEPTPHKKVVLPHTDDPVIPKKIEPKRSTGARAIIKGIIEGSKKQVESQMNSAVAAPTVTPAPLSSGFPQKQRIAEGVNMTALSVAYFCMEIGIDERIPTYSGGLGVLAGDMLKSAADLNVPMIGVTLLYRSGFFKQTFDAVGWQLESPAQWKPQDLMTQLPEQVEIMLRGRVVRVRAWLYKREGVHGRSVPIIFLDTDVEGNHPDDRMITDKLYSGDRPHRLRQEAVLGIAGLRMLEAIGAANIRKYHMNEGHSALLTVELYRRFEGLVDDPIRSVRACSVFTTHTPVPAGHDQFDREVVEKELGAYIPKSLDALAFHQDVLNMTRLGFDLSAYVNGVAKRHGEVTREMFPGYEIDAITNGVYAREWVTPAMKELFERYLPEWERDPYALRYALSIPQNELWHAHQEAKNALIQYVYDTVKIPLDDEALTIGFARRATGYKRAELLFTDLERLMRIAEKSKQGIQIIFAGKAHPDDRDGKLIIQRIMDHMHVLGGKIRCVYLPNYDIAMAKKLVGGVDLWLNTPRRPQEASGTSGMKAALNGVPQFSVLDGWWLEGHIENITGWGIGPHPEEKIGSEPEEIEEIYSKLEYVILPRFEHDRDQWIRMMRHAIAINGSFFHTHRMLEQYVVNAYFK